MKILSNYYQKEFEIDGKLNHESLEKLINNQLDVEEGVMYSYENITSNAEHPAFICTICNKSGRRIQAIGEATTSIVSCEQLYTKAAENAFDKAAIKFLELSAEVANILLTCKTVAVPQTENIKSNDDAAVCENIAENDETSDTPAHSDSNEITDIEQFGSVIITLGKYAKNPKTVKEIYDIETAAKTGWIDYICNKCTFKDAEKIEQVSAMKAFVELKNKKGE